MHYVFSTTLLISIIVSVYGLPKPQHPDASATILSEKSETLPDGYVYGFETSNQIKKDETGKLKDVPNEGNTGHEPAIVAQGSYSYVVDGKTVKVDYTADEEGFRPIVSGDGVIAPEVAAALASLPKSEPAAPPAGKR